MLQWLILLTLFFHNSLANSLYDEIDDYLLWRRQDPFTEPPSSRKLEGCKKDIIVLWDNSQSIGLKYYPNVREFLKKLVSNEKLQVGKDGTHLGFITFSNEKRTKQLLNVGEITEPEELTHWLDSLNYEKDLMGDQTFTGEAFRLANEMFKVPSPKNFRSNVPDVILLFTDGRPNPEYPNSQRAERIKYDQKIIADEYSTILKKKEVKIIGLAGGQPKNVKNFKQYVEGWSSSQEDVSESRLDELDDVVDKIIEDSCASPADQCQCEDIILDRQFIKHGGGAVVNWLPPKLKCLSGQPTIYKSMITPEGSKPGQRFAKGPHHVVYTFTYQHGGNQRTNNCSVSFNVANGQLCRGKPINHDTEVCCCGEAYLIEPGYKCCGMEYYDTFTHKCCDEKNANVVCKEAGCPAL